MNILFHISKDSLINTYKDIKRLLYGNDAIIFNAWTTVVANYRITFILPSNPSEFPQKHDEIVNRLNHPNLLLGRELMMSLMEEIWKQVLVLGGVPGIYNNDLLAIMAFQVSSEEVIIYLTPDSHWAVKWSISLHHKNINDNNEIVLELQDRNWGEIVPLHILQFIHTAINAYRQGMYASAATLLSICLESTLRDVLVAKGYSFDPTVPSVDEYPYTEADVGVNGSSFTINFRKGMPKSPKDFLLSTGAAAPVEVKIRRVINQRKKGRVDLSIIAPPDFIDYWSENVPSRFAQKRVNGLGEALDIARRKEGFLTQGVLPEDFDEVIKVIRNNLIHASENSLNAPLYVYDSSGHFTLKDFLDDELKVYDLMVYVPKFINDQYVGLRKSGQLAP